MGVPFEGVYEEIFNSDDERFGGSGVINTGDIRSTGTPWNCLADSVRLRIPPLGAVVLRCKRKAPRKRSVKGIQDRR